MKIDNITGADAIPKGVMENSRNYTNEVASKEDKIQTATIKEENKGNLVDTSA